MAMEAMEYKQEITAAATIDQIPVITDFIESFMILAGFDSRDILGVQLAVEEACTNVDRYAYSGKNGTIHIVARVNGDRLELIIEDDGKPFDPTTHAVALSQADAKDHPVGGLGILLIRCYVDRMSFEYIDGKNVLTLIKYRNQ